jgi:RimJ/RimL family protein N-acetyltransferase
MAAQPVTDIRLRKHRNVFVASDIGESLMASAYLRLESEGLLDTFFYAGIPSLSDFLGWMKRTDCRYLGGFVRSDVQPLDVELAGIGYVWSIQGPPGGRRADVGMAYFRKFQRTMVPLDLTRKMLDVCFEQLDLSVLYGISPEPNPLSWRFGERLGFTVTGPFPNYGQWHGKPAAARILYLEKSRWEELKKWQE